MIRSPFCGYNFAYCVELLCGANVDRFTMLFKQNLTRWFKKMSTWSLTYRHSVFKRQQSNNISKSSTDKMAAKTSWHRYRTTSRHCPLCTSYYADEKLLKQISYRKSLCLKSTATMSITHCRRQQSCRSLQMSCRVLRTPDQKCIRKNFDSCLFDWFWTFYV